VLRLWRDRIILDEAIRQLLEGLTSLITRLSLLPLFEYCGTKNAAFHYEC